MSPKYTIFNVQTEQYLCDTVLGFTWIKHPKHATKWTSQYKAKVFIENNSLFYCVPQLYLPKKVDAPESASATQEA